MEAFVTVFFFVFWSVLVIMVLNPELFIRLRYRINLDDMDHYKSNDSDLAPDKDEKKLDRYV